MSILSRESRQGQVGMTRSEVVRRSVQTSSLRSTAGYQADSTKMEMISSGTESGHSYQDKCGCEKCVQRLVEEGSGRFRD